MADEQQPIEVEIESTDTGWTAQRAAIEIAWAIVDGDPSGERFPLAVHAAAVELLVAIMQAAHASELQED